MYWSGLHKQCQIYFDYPIKHCKLYLKIKKDILFRAKKYPKVLFWNVNYIVWFSRKQIFAQQTSMSWPWPSSNRKWPLSFSFMYEHTEKRLQSFLKYEMWFCLLVLILNIPYNPFISWIAYLIYLSFNILIFKY